MIPFSDAAVFVQVVERGSFTAAAASLAVSKAAASKAVGRLEERLGARLLNRTTRKLTLTEAGEAFYDGAGGALRQLVAAEDAVVELTGAPRGRLKVSAPVFFGANFLVPILRDFLTRYPDIELELDLDNRIVDLVAEGFDMAIRITSLSSSSLIARRLAPSDLVTIASADYLARHGSPASPHDLRDHQCITYSLDRQPGEWHFRTTEGRDITVHVRGSLRCNSDEAIKQAALDGMGITRFPALFVTRELAEGTLVRLLQAYEPPPGTVCAVFPSRRNLAPKVRVFVDFLADRLTASVLS